MGMLSILVISATVCFANCEGLAPSLRGSAPRRASQGNSAFIDITNSVKESVRIARSCADVYTAEAGASVQVNSTFEAARFWIVPMSLEWDCNQACSECFYFDVTIFNASAIKISVGYGEHIESVLRSLETDNATSSGVQDFLLDDLNATIITGVDVWDDVQHLSLSCTAEDCGLDPLELGQGGIMNLKIWGSDQDDYLETASVDHMDDPVCAGLRCPAGWHTDKHCPTPSSCKCVCRHSHGRVQGKCRAVNDPCWMDHQCCTSRCGDSHRCLAQR